MIRRDTALALALLAGSLLELALRDLWTDAVVIAAALLMTAPLAVRRLSAWFAYAGFMTGFALITAHGREPDATAEIVALWVLCYTFGELASRRSAIRGLVALALPLGASVAIADPMEVIWVVGVFVVPPWTAGRLMRGRRRRIDEIRALNERLERERKRTALLAADVERARLATDIRLVLADRVRAIGRLAEEGQAAVGVDDAAATRAFQGIRAAGTEATAELRRLLGVLRENPPDPARTARP